MCCVVAICRIARAIWRLSRVCEPDWPNPSRGPLLAQAASQDRPHAVNRPGAGAVSVVRQPGGRSANDPVVRWKWLAAAASLAAVAVLGWNVTKPGTDAGARLAQGKPAQGQQVQQAIAATSAAQAACDAARSAPRRTAGGAPPVWRCIGLADRRPASCAMPRSSSLSADACCHDPSALYITAPVGGHAGAVGRPHGGARRPRAGGGAGRHSRTCQDSRSQHCRVVDPHARCVAAAQLHRHFCCLVRRQHVQCQDLACLRWRSAGGAGRIAQWRAALDVPAQ